MVVHSHVNGKAAARVRQAKLFPSAEDQRLDELAREAAAYPARRLAELAIAINGAHQAGEEKDRGRLRDFWNAGAWLIEAKGLLAQENDDSSYGLWLPWLEANVPTVAGRTLRKYMRFYKLAPEANFEDLDGLEEIWETVCHRQADEEPADDPPAAPPAARRYRWDDPDHYPRDGNELPERKPPPPPEQVKRQKRKAWENLRLAENAVSLAQRLGLRYNADRELLGRYHDKGLELLEEIEAHKRAVPAAVRRKATEFAEEVEGLAERVDSLAGFGDSLEEFQRDCKAHERRCTPPEPPPWVRERIAAKKKQQAANGGR
jgi:hypothetical protein